MATVLVDLSPWPTADDEIVRARASLALQTDQENDDRLEAVGATAAALVERYAANAPQAVKNEAVTRTAGYLMEQPMPAIRESSIGELSYAIAPSHVSALRHSGAMALLSPWKVRRAGAIG